MPTYYFGGKTFTSDEPLTNEELEQALQQSGLPELPVQVAPFQAQAQAALLGGQPFGGAPPLASAATTALQRTFPAAARIGLPVAAGLATGGLGAAPALAGAFAGGALGEAAAETAESGAPGLLGPLAMGGANALLQGVTSIPWRSLRLFQMGAGTRAAKTAEAVEAAAPDLGTIAGVTPSAEGLQDVLVGALGQTSLQTARAGRLADLKDLLKGVPPERVAEAVRAAGIQEGEAGALPEWLVTHLGKQGLAPKKLAEEILDAQLEKLKALGKPKTPMDYAAREKVTNEITAFLREVDPSGEALARYGAMQQAYGRGAILQEAATKSKALASGTFDRGALQAWVRANQRRVEQALGEAWPQFRRALYEGGPTTGQDVTFGIPFWTRRGPVGIRENVPAFTRLANPPWGPSPAALGLQAVPGLAAQFGGSVPVPGLEGYLPPAPR